MGKPSYLVLDRKIAQNVLSDEEISILDLLINKIKRIEGYRKYEVKRIE